MRARLPVSLALLLTLAPASAHAGFHLVNLDGPGFGLNDPTPVAPVGGNPGTTVGQQRINVFERAGAIWDRILDSPVQIEFEVFFGSFGCTLRNVHESLAKMQDGLTPVIDTEVPLRDFESALTRLESRAVFGKIIVTF